MQKHLTAIMIGAGSRGHAAYGKYALEHPDEIRFVAIAEPNEVRRARFAKEHAIPPERQFHGWEDLLDRGQIADTALICTPDRLHADPAVAALEAGYDVLLEKPMAPTLADCVRIAQTAKRTGRLLQLCHVLRYAPFFSTVHEIVTSGRLGDVIAVEQRDNLVYWHMAHSYVRGIWRNSKVECPIVVAKCCHDLDILYWNLGPCARLSSFGSLKHYRLENAPPGAPERCSDGCPVADECAWNAQRAYLELLPLWHVAKHLPNLPLRLAAVLVIDHPRFVKTLRRLIPALDEALDYKGWPISTTFDDASQEGRRHALQTGLYGRCVYHCDNDVVDYQTVSMSFESGASATLILNGHSHEDERIVRYDGTRATLTGRFAYGRKHVIEIHDHMIGRTEIIDPTPSRSGHHGGGDAGVMASFVRAVRGHAPALTTAQESLESYLMAFAAEEARLSGTVVDMKEFRSALSDYHS
jgi:predicted dehydrogenase